MQFLVDCVLPGVNIVFYKLVINIIKQLILPIWVNIG